MFTATRLLIAEGSFFLAWGVANVGVRLLPKDHPLRHYHAYSKSQVRSVYIKAARIERLG